MELKLNIYGKNAENRKVIVNTYKAETYDLMWATVEDLINILDLEGLKTNDDVELIKIATKVVTKGLNTILKPLLKDIFEGLTDDELRNTKISEIVTILISVVKFAMNEIGIGTNEKN